jgi:hypothetical protein
MFDVEVGVADETVHLVTIRMLVELLHRARLERPKPGRSAQSVARI